MKRADIVKALADLIYSLNYDSREEIVDLHFYSNGLLVIAPCDLTKIQYKNHCPRLC